MMKNRILIFPVILLLAGCTGKESIENDSISGALPNIVFIYADDLGYGDLGCYGATKIETPNLDKMASDGIKFTEFYSISPVCSPSRAGLMTGRYPIRMGIHGVFFPESWTGLPLSEITVANKLKEKGYATGIVGKWHLGHHLQFLPLQRGFDEYFGIPYSNDMEAVVYLRGNDVEVEDVDQTQCVKTYTREAIDFIERHQDEPFFLYLPHSMPHVPIYASDDFLDKSELGLYGDVIEEIDWSVGQVIGKLKELGLEENTIVVFSSDNGPWLTMCEHGGSAGILRCGKQTTFEGGMRVPTIMQWKAKVKPGQVINEMGNMMDWFPTFMSITGNQLPSDRTIDGRDLTPLITGTGNRETSDLGYWSNGKLMAFRSGEWKIKMPRGPYHGRYTYPGESAHDTLLFNLMKDPGEKYNLFQDNPEKITELMVKMQIHLDELGTLPPGLELKGRADNSHQIYLRDKYGSAK